MSFLYSSIWKERWKERERRERVGNKYGECVCVYVFGVFCANFPFKFDQVDGANVLTKSNRISLGLYTGQASCQ